jgi:hypothetical protein
MTKKPYKREKFALKVPDIDYLVQQDIEDDIANWDHLDDYATDGPSLGEIRRGHLLYALSFFKIKTAEETLEQLWWW